MEPNKYDGLLENKNSKEYRKTTDLQVEKVDNIFLRTTPSVSL